jgi:hypothetical protein
MSCICHCLVERGRFFFILNSFWHGLFSLNLFGDDALLEASYTSLFDRYYQDCNNVLGFGVGMSQWAGLRWLNFASMISNCLGIRSFFFLW